MYSLQAEAIIKDFEISNASLDDFIANIQLNIISKTHNTIQFDILNCHPSVANALRRILVSRVPTVAIHEAFVYENTTVFPDEYIVHRLGLVPLMADPEDFGYFKGEETFDNCLNFRIHKKADTERVSLMSDDIVFVPSDGQEGMQFSFVPGVLICKLAPGNEIDMRLKAIKGRGEHHAKFSPVSLCSYRLMPRIILERDYTGDEAEELKSCFSPGVIEIVDGRARVVNPRAEGMSREVLRHENLSNGVKIMREGGWFCFTVETLALDPLKVVRMGLEELIKSCKELKDELKQANDRLE